MSLAQSLLLAAGGNATLANKVGATRVAGRTVAAPSRANKTPATLKWSGRTAATQAQDGHFIYVDSKSTSKKTGSRLLSSAVKLYAPGSPNTDVVFVVDYTDPASYNNPLPIVDNHPYSYRIMGTPADIRRAYKAAGVPDAEIENRLSSYAINIENFDTPLVTQLIELERQKAEDGKVASLSANMVESLPNLIAAYEYIQQLKSDARATSTKFEEDKHYRYDTVVSAGSTGTVKSVRVSTKKDIFDKWEEVRLSLSNPKSQKYLDVTGWKGDGKLGGTKVVEVANPSQGTSGMSRISGEYSYLNRIRATNADAYASAVRQLFNEAYASNPGLQEAVELAIQQAAADIAGKKRSTVVGNQIVTGKTATVPRSLLSGGAAAAPATGSLANRAGALNRLGGAAAATPKQPTLLGAAKAPAMAKQPAPKLGTSSLLNRTTPAAVVATVAMPDDMFSADPAVVGNVASLTPLSEAEAIAMAEANGFRVDRRTEADGTKVFYNMDTDESIGLDSGM